MSFNFIAPFYDQLAAIVFGQTLKRAQASLLAHIPADASILIVGGGTGWLLEKTLDSCLPRRVVYLEASARMLAMTKTRLMYHSLYGRVAFQHGTEVNLETHERFDVIMTPFVLDLFQNEILHNQFLPRLYNALAPSGYWLITDFVPTNVWWHRILSQSMYLFFRLLSAVQASQLPHWPSLLTQYTSLQAQQRQTFWQGFILSQLYQRTQ